MEWVRMWVFAFSQSTNSPSIQIFFVGVIGIASLLPPGGSRRRAPGRYGGRPAALRPGSRTGNRCASGSRVGWGLVGSGGRLPWRAGRLDAAPALAYLPPLLSPGHDGRDARTGLPCRVSRRVGENRYGRGLQRRRGVGLAEVVEQEP